MGKLPDSFYQRDDVVGIARELMGKYLLVNTEGILTGGVIVETEAYRAPEDRGSHAFNNRRTARNNIMFATGGVVYMYICYGIHDMLNIVTGTENRAHAVLIRALQPVVGIEFMRERRAILNDDSRLCRGPGALAKALALRKIHNGISLQEDEIWIEDRGLVFADQDIIAAPRIGLNIEEPYQSIAWRFYKKGDPNVSKPHV
ncbi:MAG TPA: DNA-3-methyladenine glycosylase [Sphingobacteriaceae bacterium]|nr:DNA-3-methyladenine glycosylase [Sphingobacteriaceae bacterium]